jgi:hypothetical protein
MNIAEMTDGTLYISSVRFGALMMVTLKITVFWDMTMYGVNHDRQIPL